MAELAVLARGAVPSNAPAATYTGDDKPGMLKEVLWTNTTADEITVTLWLVPHGTGAATQNKLYGDFPVPAHSVYRDVYTTLLEPRDSLVWQASAPGLNGYITGLADMPTGRFGEVTTI